MSHTESYQSRVSLLELSLSHTSRWVRDGAALGLAAIKDIHSILYLCDAIEKENNKDLKIDMIDVLDRLRDYFNVEISVDD